MSAGEDPTGGWLGNYLSQQPQPEVAVREIEEVRPGEWRGIWTWVEVTQGEVLPASLELIGRGRELADELGTRNGAVIFGHGVTETARNLAHYGADRVYVLDDPSFEHFDLARAREALVDLVETRRPEILLLPATIQGRNLGAQASMALRCGIVPNCNLLTLEATERTLVGHQTSFNERLVSEVLSPIERPQVFTVTPGSFRRPSPDPLRTTQLVEVPRPTDTSRVKVLQHLGERTKSTSQQDALVAGGLGMRSPEGFGLVRELAKELNAAIGGTRGAMNVGWADRTELVTVTRETLRPRLYVACGVVGEYEHLKAVEDAELVIALVPDANAPIAEQADLVAVGEPVQLVTRLLTQLRKAKTQRLLVHAPKRAA